MIAAFDASVFLLAVDERALPPSKEGADPADARDRVEYLIETLDAQHATIVVPTPVLTELLIRSGPGVSELLAMIDAMAHVKFEPFGLRAAIECGAMLRKRWQSGKTKGLGQNWPKAKFDHQIVAIAKVHGAEIVYSDDRGVCQLAMANKIGAQGIWDLPERPKPAQAELKLEQPGDRKGD